MALASRNEILKEKHPTNLEFTLPRKDPLICSRSNFHIEPRPVAQAGLYLGQRLPEGSRYGAIPTEGGYSLYALMTSFRSFSDMSQTTSSPAA